MTINHAGPYEFLLDTGAQITIVEPSLAEELQLKPKGEVNVISVAANATAHMVALGKKIAPQAIGDLGCSDRPQHQRMRHLHLLGMEKQVIVDPAGEDRRFPGHHPGLWQCVDPGIKFLPG